MLSCKQMLTQFLRDETQQQHRHAQHLAEMESKKKLEQATHKKALHFYYWESGPVAMVTTSDLKCVWMWRRHPLWRKIGG